MAAAYERVTSLMAATLKRAKDAIAAKRLPIFVLSRRMVLLEFGIAPLLS